MADRNLRIGVDSRDSVKGFDDARRAGDRYKKTAREATDATDAQTRAFQTAARAATAFVAGVGIEALRRFTVSMYRHGTAVEETAAKYETVFGPSVGRVNEFIAENARLMGLSNQSAQELTASAGALAQGMGFVGTQSADVSTRIVSLAADLASFNNLQGGAEDATRRVMAAMTGETESLKALNIVLRQNEVVERALLDTGKESADQLTQQERALASLNLIYEKAGVAVGDLERTQDSAANTGRRVSAMFRDLRDTLATAVLPILAETLDAIDANEEALERWRRGIEKAGESAGKVVDVIRAVAFGFSGGFANVGTRLGVLTGLRDIREQIEAIEEARETELTALQKLVGLGDRARAAAQEESAAIQSSTEALDERLDLLKTGAEWGILTTDEAEELLGIYRDANRALESGAGTLEDRVRWAEREREAAEGIVAARRAAGELAPNIRDITGTGFALDQVEGATGLDLSWTRETAQILSRSGDEVGQAGEEAANRWERAFVSAASGIGNAVGGITQDILGIASAFAAGGVIGGGIAIGGFALGELLRDEEDELRRARDQWADALDGFVQELAGGSRIDAIQRSHEQQLGGFFQGAIQNALQGAVIGGPGAVRDLLPEIARLGEIFETEGLQAAIDAARDLGPEFEELAFAAEMAGEEIRRLREEEFRRIAQIKERANAEQEAAEATAIATEMLNQWNAELFGRETDAMVARNRGDDVGAEIIELGIIRDQKIQRAQELFNEGVIGIQEVYDRAGAAQEEYRLGVERLIKSQIEAAMVEQFRAEQDMRNLEVRLLSAQGRDEEAAEMRQQIELLDAIAAGRSAEYIALLEQVHAAEDMARAQRAQEQAQRRVEFAIRETTRAADQFARVLNAPTGLATNLYRWGALVGSSGFVPATGGAGGGIVIEGDLNIQAAPGDDGEALFEEFMAAANRRARRGQPVFTLTSRN